jgi:hypothetical protein
MVPSSAAAPVGGAARARFGGGILGIAVPPRVGADRCRLRAEGEIGKGIEVRLGRLDRRDALRGEETFEGGSEIESDGDIEDDDDNDGLLFGASSRIVLPKEFDRGLGDI